MHFRNAKCSDPPGQLHREKSNNNLTIDGKSLHDVMVVHHIAESEVSYMNK